MNDYPTTSQEDVLSSWLDTFQRACTSQNVEMISLTLIERNSMGILSTVDTQYRSIAGPIQKLRFALPAQCADLRSQQFYISPCLTKGCEALASAARFADVAVKASNTDYNRTIRSLNFGIIIPLLFKLASIATLVPSYHQCGSVVFPHNLTSLADSARAALGPMLRTFVVGRSLHYLHLSKDMLSTCEDLCQSLSAPVRSGLNDELAKLQAFQVQSMCAVLSILSNFQTSDLSKGMCSPQGTGGPPVLNAMPQVDGLVPQEYIAFLRSMSNGCTSINATLLQKHITLRRAVDGYVGRCGTLVSELESYLGYNSREDNYQRKSLTGQIQQPFGLGNPQSSSTLDVPDAIRYRLECAERCYTDSCNSAVPLRSGSSLRQAATIQMTRPSEVSSFFQQCEGTPRTEYTSYDRDASVNSCRTKSPQMVQTCGASEIPRSESERLLLSCNQSYERKCHAMSTSLAEGRITNKTLAESLVSQRQCNQHLYRMLTILQESVNESQILGQRGPGALVTCISQKVQSSEGQLYPAVRRPLEQQPTNNYGNWNSVPIHNSPTFGWK